MTLLSQLTVLAVFAGLTISLAKSLPKRVVLAINAFAAGSILFFIVITTSTVINRGAEMVDASTKGTGFLGNFWLFMAVASVAIFAIPLVLVFVFKERRRSVIIAAAIGLLNLGLGMTLSGDFSTGLVPMTALTIAMLVFLFLLEGVAIGALLMKSAAAPVFLLSLGLAAVLPALAGFNISSPNAIDTIIPFAYAASAGFMIFYLPFILGAGDSPQDIKWHFIGMIFGLFSTGLVVTALTMFIR